MAYISRLLVMLLNWEYFRLESTLEFIKIDCEVVGIEGDYVTFRIDYDIQMVFFVYKKWGNTSSSIKGTVEGEFHK